MTRSFGARATAAAAALASCSEALTLRPEAELELPLRLEDGHVPLFVKWEDYLGEDLSNVNFVQVGGNCGTNLPECAVGGDPIWEYATRFAWNGIVIEPVPRIFEKLSENYKPFPSIKPVHCLVSDHSGAGKIIDHSEISHEISLSRRNGVEVETFTLVDLWKKKFGSNEKKVDILVVDAEGNEPKILGGPIPEPRPRFVLFEISSLKAEELKSIDDNLHSYGYELVEQLRHQDPLGKNMPPQDALYKLVK